MKLSPAAILRQRERVASRVVEGMALVVVLDNREIHKLSGVAARIWHLCDGRTAAEVCDAVVSEYEVDRATAEADLEDFARDLEKVGALTIEEPCL